MRAYLIYVKVGVYKYLSWVCDVVEKNLTLGVGNSTRESASLVPGRNSNPSGEISLSYMDTHDGLLYSYIRWEPILYM